MLSAPQIIDRIKQAFGPAAVKSAVAEGLHPWASLDAAQWPAIARFLRDDPQIDLVWLRSITGLDYPDKKLLCAAYDLMSMQHGHEFCIRVFVDRTKAEIPSVAGVWGAADWHERETYDLLGINFTAHPDSITDDAGTHPRRILLPEDWEGFPLRKDYVFPKGYHGIPGTVEAEWAQKENYPK